MFAVKMMKGSNWGTKRVYLNKQSPSSPHSFLRFSSSTAKFVEVEEKNKIVYITLNRPELHNAFNEKVIEELYNAFTHKVKESATARAVVLTGNGKSFSAGADLNWMKSMVNYSFDQNLQDSRALFSMFSAIKNCPLPVIGRVNGAALGGGCGLVSVCDFSYAINKAIFGFTEVKLGLIPAVISPFVIHKIGAHSSQLFLTGEKFGVDTAVRIGLINKSFNTIEELDESLELSLNELRGNSPHALIECKKLIAEVSKSKEIDNVKDYVCNAIAQARISPEGQEGLSSFLNKTTPSWSK